jgi:chloramphenicol O-acetyltransferase type A
MKPMNLPLEGPSNGFKGAIYKWNAACFHQAPSRPEAEDKESRRMTATIVDLTTWPRADQFRFFRGYERPHYAVTARVDVTRLMTQRKAAGISPYRACLYAIGAGIHAVPELCMRFQGDVVTRYGAIELSMTVPLTDGNFRYAYVPFLPDFAAFDTQAAALIAAVAVGGALNANSGQRDDLAYLSCMPWLDYSSINNALPHANDCIPRISWGKFVEGADGRWSMAMTIEVHHALVDGRQVGDYFVAVQAALATV